MARGSPHEFDLVTDFCVRCGCSRIDEDKGFRLHCDEVGNVVGISHIVLLRKWKEPLREVCAELVQGKSPPTEPKKA